MFRHETQEDFLATLSAAHLYAKTVTLGPTHWPRTNQVMLRNRRIGCSMSGIAQFVSDPLRGLEALRRWSDAGYNHLKACDEQISERFAVPKSIKLTSIKPSGTVSLLAGATAGLHYPEAAYYIRRVRLSVDAVELWEPLRECGYAWKRNGEREKRRKKERERERERERVNHAMCAVLCCVWSYMLIQVPWYYSPSPASPTPGTWWSLT
jgi:hypothetical protein